VADAGRERRQDGRPEQARPRDRTGRPLPHDTTGILLAEEHEPATVEAALALGARLWGQGRLFEAHECLKHVWHAAPLDDQDLWQGVIQVAVAGVHLQCGNRHGALALVDRARQRLARYPSQHRGVDVAAARDYCLEVTRVLAPDARGAPASTDEVPLPRFPATDGGAWFTPDAGALEPPGSPTPTSDPSDRLAAGRPRRPRRREA
jgi:uncharacterized protein